MSLADIGFAGALSAPWIFKPLWAPWVDRWGSARWGRRKSWIVPMQALLAVACFVAAVAAPSGVLAALLACVFAMNLFAATMDIAVDGLAIDMLGEHQLGHGNALQVVGYKAGMLVGGGLLIWLSQWIEWSGVFVAMGVMTLATMGATLATAEPPRANSTQHTSVRQVVGSLWSQLSRRSDVGLLVVIASYKSAEALMDPMTSPFFVDRGVSREQIGLWVGTYGMVCSVLGSLFGGWLAKAAPLRVGLTSIAALRCIPIFGLVALSLATRLDTRAVPLLTMAEHFVGGALTTLMFTFMMSRVDRTIGGTHYTALAAIEVLGKAPLGLVSGWWAERVGWPGLFASAAVLSIAFVPLAWWGTGSVTVGTARST